MTLAVFLLLQLGDLATTVAFLARGVSEGNPVIVFLMSNSAHPALALLLVKGLACLMAWWAWRSGRSRLVRRANVFFAFCVLWNLAACAG